MESSRNRKVPPSRRSATNLSHLTLAPLTSRIVDDDDDAPPPRSSMDEPYDANMTSPALYTTTSYIQGKSAPTTPGILSRNTSATQLKTPGGGASSRSYPHLAFADDATGHLDVPLHHRAALAAAGTGVPLSKSQSTTVLSPGARRRRQKRRGEGLTGGDSGEWLFRAGTAISSEARESKGQSWLVSRESSTSLAPQPLAAGEESPVASRGGSRTGSARTSRRPSRQGGSRPDLAALGMTSAGSAVSLTTPTPRVKTPLTRQATAEDYFGKAAVGRDPATMVGPDFVDRTELEAEEVDEEVDVEDGEEEEENRRLEEAEVARLAREQSRGGFGGLVDRVVSWTLFDMKEEREAEEAQSEEEKENRTLRKEDSRITAGPQLTPSARDGSEEDGGGGWKDAAWLFSVASKVLY